MHEKQDMLINKTIEILREHPLCDECLGRQFAGLMKGFTNKERGAALKKTVVMHLIELIKKNQENALKTLEAIASSLGEEYDETLEEIGIKPTRKTCWLCNGKLNEWIKLYKIAVQELRERRIDSFVVGVRMTKELIMKEDMLWRKHGITTGESIKSEVKREIGKKITAETGIQPDFNEPGAIVYLDTQLESISVKTNPLLLKGRYLKTGRNISQTTWITRKGERYYKLSVEEMASVINEYYLGERVILHASGREDIDARMLGNGRPMVIEIKNPYTRRTPISLLNMLINRRNKWGKFVIEGKTDRETVREIKTTDSLKQKIYRALVYSLKELSEDDALNITRYFKNRLIEQKTPRRVLHRRADLTRRKTVYSVKTRILSPHLMETMIHAEGGLYIKELISGDDGRTKPSLAEVIGKPLECIELDVLKIIEPVQKI